MRLLVCVVLLCGTACATTPPVDADRGAVASAPVLATSEQAVAAPAEEPPARATVASQYARVSELEALEGQVTQAASGLPTTTTVVFDGTVPRQITGVPWSVAQRWVLEAENEVRRRVASEQWEGLDVADFVRRELDLKVHESTMPSNGGLVPPSAIQQYIDTFREILRRARTDEAFRVTFHVQTLPKGATFLLCREYVPTDCTAVGTNVTFDRIFRGKYIYTITMGGYHSVSSIPLNLVNFTQSILKCPLRKLTDGTGPVPCTPQ